MIPVSLFGATYGRTKFLAETIESYRIQDYNGETELVFKNTCPLQKIYCDVPGVTIINTDEREQSVGSILNELIKAAKYPNCQMWDDDDIVFPHHISSIVNVWKQGEPASRGYWNWVLSGGVLRRHQSSPLRCVIFDRDQFFKLGGFDPAKRMFDEDFVYRAVYAGWFRGSHFNKPMFSPSVIYRPDIDGPHITSTDSQKSYRDIADNRIRDGFEPDGDVLIIPKWNQDYKAFIKNFDKI